MIPYIGPEMIAAIREGLSFTSSRADDDPAELRVCERREKITPRTISPAKRSPRANDILVTVKLVWLR